MLGERGSSESVKAGQSELGAAAALEFGGLELLPWLQPSWQRAPSPGRQGRANTELILCPSARAGGSWLRALETLLRSVWALRPVSSAWAQLLPPLLAEQVK